MRSHNASQLMFLLFLLTGCYDSTSKSTRSSLLRSLGVPAGQHEAAVLGLADIEELFPRSAADDISNRGGSVRAVILASQATVFIDHNVLRVVRTDGMSVVVGQRGSGPGEFRALSAICTVSRTSVAVLDDELSRLTVISEDGAVLGSTQLPPGHWRLPAPRCDSNSRVIALRLSAAGPSNRVSFAITAFALHLWDGAIDSLWTQSAAAPNHLLDRQLSLIRWADTTILGSGVNPSVLAVPDSGSEAPTTLRIGLPPRAMSKSLIRDRVGMSLPRGMSRAERLTRERLARSSVERWLIPAYSELLGDGQGVLWARVHTSTSGEALWLSYGASGELTGSLIVPARNGEYTRLRLIALRGSNAVLLAERADGSPVLLSAAVERPASGDVVTDIVPPSPLAPRGQLAVASGCE